jgi:site-specific DNA recombinase
MISSKIHDGLLQTKGTKATIKPKKVTTMGEAVIYTRVSTSEQAEKRSSLDSQAKICTDFAIGRDITIDRIFREEGESAKTADRTKLLEMIKYCQDHRGEIKYVIVFKVDRFARRAEDHLMLKALLMKAGVQLLSATEPIENSNTGRLMETILAGFAEFDNGVKSERSSGGMKSRLEEGGWVHLAPIGYRNIRDDQKRPTLEADEMAPNVQGFLMEFAKGKFAHQEAHKLALSYGIKSKSGKQISPNGVSKMLRNPLYAGMVVNKMLLEPVPGLHSGLITVAEYEAIIGLLNGRRRSIAPSSRGKPEWPLRRFIICSKCSQGATGSISRGRTKRYAYYHCASCKGGLRVSREVMHAEFEALMERVKPASYTLKLFREITLRRWNEEFKDVQAKRRAIDEQIHQYEERRQRVFDRNLDGVMSDEDMSEQLERISMKKAELVGARGELYEGELEKEAIVDVAVSFMANAGRLWKLANLEDRQRFQKMLYPDGISYSAAEGFGTALMGLCYQEISLIEAEKQKEAATSAASFDENYTMVPQGGIEPSTLSLGRRRSIH